MERRKQEENTSVKSNTVVKAIIGVVGTVAVGAVTFWGMPIVQKKMADKIYKKMK